MTPGTAAYQAPPSMGFSRQEYWSALPLPSPFTLATSIKYWFYSVREIILKETGTQHLPPFILNLIKKI